MYPKPRIYMYLTVQFHASATLLLKIVFVIFCMSLHFKLVANICLMVRPKCAESYLLSSTQYVLMAWALIKHREETVGLFVTYPPQSSVGVTIGRINVCPWCHKHSDRSHSEILFKLPLYTIVFPFSKSRMTQ
jgi:hypothetical protein